MSRIAAGVFVLFYGAAETILGIATGVPVRHADEAPASERPAVVAAIQDLWDDPLSGEVAATIGGVAWVVAILAAAVALRQAGAPLAVPLVLALSSAVALHAPPIGPLGLVRFAVAVVLLVRSDAWPGRSPAAATVTDAGEGTR